MILNTLSIISLVIGLVFVACGLFMKFYPPVNINDLYGYRTGSSMRNPETWQLANRYDAQLLWQSGLLLMFIGGLAVFLPVSPLSGAFSAIFLMFAVVGLTIYLTEKHINKHFDKQGNRRT